MALDVVKGAHWVREALERTEGPPPAGGDATRRAHARARCFLVLGMLSLRLGDFMGTREWASRAAAIERSLNDPFMLAFALGMIGSTSAFFGDMVALRGIIEESTALFRAGENPWWMAMTLPLLARAASDAGDAAASQRYQDEARRLTATIEHPMLLSTFLGMGLEARGRGDLALARHCFEQGIRLIRRVKNRAFEMAFQSELVHVVRQSGEYEAALSGYRRMIVMWQNLGMRAAVANQLECLAFILRTRDQPGRAARLLGAAEALRERIHIPMADYERAEYEREVMALRAQMDAAAYDAAWAEGHTMTLDQAVEHALAGDQIQGSSAGTTPNC